MKNYFEYNYNDDKMRPLEFRNIIDVNNQTN